MAYQDEETSLTSSRPIELYEFVGTYNSYYFTSYSQAVTSGGQVYDPIAIDRNKFRVGTQEQVENALEVTMPFNNQLVTEYAFQNAPPNLSLTLMRAHETDLNDTVTLWSGRVTAFSVEGVKAKLKVPALFSYVLQGNAPTPRFQSPCNHILYDVRCGIDPALHQNVTTVVSVAGLIIEVAAFPWADNTANAGVMFTPAGEQRMVISNISKDVTVSYSFSNLNVGDVVTIRKGCNHSFESDCKLKFSNGPRFGGFPIVPARNPFTSTLT